MSLRTRVIALTAVCLPLILPAAALAGDPHLKLPAFDHLQRIATDSVNITIGRWPLAIAAWALNQEDAKDAEAASAREVLRGLRAVYVRSYEFAADDMYSKADIEAVRQQLSLPGWNALAQIRQRRPDAEDVDVCVSIDHDKVNGLAIVVSGPRKFTIVNIVGSFDPAKLEAIEDRLGLPSLSL